MSQKTNADIEKLTNLGAGPKQFPCPLCGADMIIKLGRSGTFLSCHRFPDCTGARLIDGSELKEEIAAKYKTLVSALGDADVELKNSLK